ncbi:MAG: hypothetical protein KAX44_05195 [Candidatus Brocadiae bacterium]|nr:hypothetical protein [Candidatus Brocadiia bacterium]
MRVTCECGHEFDVEPGAENATCPRCGREVKVEAAEGWLDTVQLEDMSLQEDAGQPQPDRPGVPEGTTPEAPAELELEQRGPSAQVPEPTPRPLDREPVEEKPPAEAAPPPGGPIGLLRIIAKEPKEALPYFETGIKDRRFIAQTAGLLLGLMIVTAVVQAFAAAPRAFAIGSALGNWFSMFCELLTAAVMLNLICVALKREPKPLGVSQGLAVVRIGSLIVMVPVCFIVAVIALLTSGGEGSPGAVVWLARHLLMFYGMVVCLGQMFLVVGLLKLGCLPSLILSFVVTYAGFSMAEKLLG